MRVCTFFRRYWLVLVVTTIALLTILAPYTVDAQATPTPTPDVNTVPPLDKFFTPTPTTPPVQVPIVTATPVETIPTAESTATSPVSDSPPTGSADAQGSETGSADNDNTTAPDVGENTNAETSSSLETQSADDGTSPLDTATAVFGDGEKRTVTAAVDQLLLMMLPDRGFTWQGQPLRVTLTIQNLGSQPATAIQLRSELPPALVATDVIADGSATIAQQPTARDEHVLLVTWPELAAGATVAVTMTIAVDAATANGTLIDTFAVASAQDIPAVAAGISIAMPPAEPPRF